MSTSPLQAEIKTLHLNEPFRIAHGTSTSREVLRLRWSGGVGEAPFVPYYGEKAGETLAWLQRQHWQGSPVPEEGPRAGRLALDLLWHDIVGKERGEPLWKMWGLNGTGAPAGCRSISIPVDLDDFGVKVQEISQQFQVLKLKAGSGNADFDEALVSKARESAPHVRLMVDANGGWSPADAARLIPRLAAHGVALIEQPVHHEGGVEAWRELRGHLGVSSPVPLYADESAQKADDVLKLAGLVEGVNVKLLKSGSLEEARTMIRFARANRMGVLLGCMIESCLGVTAAAHLAPLADWIDLDGHLYVADDDATGISYDSEGRLMLPSGPGLGVTLRAH